MKTTLADVLNQHLANHGWSFERLAEEADLPRNTVYRWTRGEVRRVRHWQDVAEVARALMLNRSQTNALLQIAGHPPIEALLERATDEEDRALLSGWTLTAPNNLPAQLTSFIGRQEERERLLHLLSSARLITLTGTGGSGKTRLAVEVAQSALDQFEEAHFVDLASISSPERVIPTISQTLVVRQSLDDLPLRVLEAHLRDRSALLVLDNFEQVIEAAPVLTKLLAAAPRTKAIVTSRTRLHVRGEYEFPVSPLPVPCPTSGLGALSRNPSVALFADRARAADPSFTLTPGSASIVADVCTRLEGLPLGIELAAAKVRQVTLGSMLERFPARLRLASEGPRDMPDRQRTLRATIAWSYHLLGCEEQRLFNYIGVFAGGFTEDAAGAVCSAIRQIDVEVSEGLKTLVEQNLLKRIFTGENDEPRFEMLETIREYALERLEASKELDSAQRAASEYYLRLAEEADLEGEGQAYWLHKLIAEHDNIGSALDWCREQGQMAMGLRLSVELMPLWHLRDHQLEARSWLETFMVAIDDVSPTVRAKGLLWKGLLLMSGTGDGCTASPLYEEALALFRDGGDVNGASETLQAQGDVHRHRGELTIAAQRYAGSLELAEQTGNDYLAAHGWMGLALCAQEERQFKTAQRYWKMMLESAERAGNEASVALALNSLGEMARYDEDWELAERYYERTLGLARELVHEPRMALALHNLGYAALGRGQPEKAKGLFADSLLLYEGRQHHKGVAECLAGLGRVEASQGKPERAARLCGAAEAILERLGTRLDTLDRIDYDRTQVALGDQLDEKLETLLDEGRAMSMDQAIAYAVSDA